ncbi:MAG: riboflavin biosynthesis protein RibF [Armatimonadetes bacterium]|nr:riboflavin biosynthesis protein RibF [Armatimonadota bacterium]
MDIHFGPELLVPEWPGSVACIGTFDGVHLGHQAVIRRAVDRARELQLPCTLVTFDRHPAAVLHPARAPQAVDSLAANLAAFERLGVSVALVLPFTAELSQTTAQNFFDGVLRDRLRAKEIVVGHDFAFGQNREGDGNWLAQRLPTSIVEPFLFDGLRVSSSAVRAAVGEGRMEDAHRWLGRPFRVHSVVVGGQRLGRTIGYPTLNLARSFNQVVPAYGVYGARASGSFGSYMAAVSIGERPTVNGVGRTIEAYLLDYPGDEIYGCTVDLDLFFRLRGEERFDSLEAMVAQIDRDVDDVRLRMKAEDW